MQTQTICTKCNAVLEDGTEFCQECGTKVDIALETAHEDVFCPECGVKTTTEFTFCPDCGKPLGEEKSDVSVATEKLDKKKFVLPVKPLYLGVAAAMVVVLVVVIATIMGGSGSVNGNRIIYAKDKELQFAYLSDLKPFQLTERLTDGSYTPDASDLMRISTYILMSDNGRYVFYPDRAGDDGFTYYWRDLKADNSKKETVTKIDSEISIVPHLTNDGSKLFYVKGDDRRLYIFDRKTSEKNKLDDSVKSFYINEEGDYLIYDTYKDGEYSVYEMTIKGLAGEKNKLDSSSEIHTAFANDKKVYYLKEDTLYFKEFGKDKVRIASDVNQVVSVVDATSLYYLKTEEVTNKLSDFISDDMAADDRNLTEPSPKAYPEEPTYPSEYDYQHNVWYASYWGDERHPDTNESGYWYQQTDHEAYSVAYEQYQTDYSAWEIEYNRLRSEYNAEVALYQGKESRDELRAALDDEENAVTYNKYNLYYWTQSGDILVASDLSSNGYSQHLATSSKIPAVVYQKYNTSASGNQKLSELLSDSNGYFYINDVIWDIKNRVTATRNISEDIYIASGEKESIVECGKTSNWAISQNGSIYFLDDYNSDKNYGVLKSIAVSGGGISKPVKIDDDVIHFRFGNDHKNVYYFKDIKNGTGDLYLNGKTIATDVYTSSLYNFKNSETLLYYTDYSSKNEKGTLCILKNGAQAKIADDVSFFTPIDEKNTAYLIDYNRDRQRGDLMLYNGISKPTLVDSDVTALLWSPKMMWGNYTYYSWNY